MARISLPEVTIRTTTDGDGYSHGIAVGVNHDPAGALAELAAEARKMITEMVSAADVAEHDVFGPEDWDIEVVDVRLVPGPEAGAEADQTWTAYGTLRTTRLSPLRP
jgi:hypothetical protein